MKTYFPCFYWWFNHGIYCIYLFSHSFDSQFYQNLLKFSNKFSHLRNYITTFSPIFMYFSNYQTEKFMHAIKLDSVSSMSTCYTTVFSSSSSKHSYSMLNINEKRISAPTVHEAFIQCRFFSLEPSLENVVIF